NLALVSVVGSVGLMILTGFAGQISLGHAAFLAIGAYTAAIAGSRWQLPFWLLLPLGGALSAALGLAVGVFALRLEGLYLAIVTIGLLFLVEHVLLSFPAYTQGYTGIAVPMYAWFGGGPAVTLYEPRVIGPVELGFEQQQYFVFLLIAVGVAWAAKNVRRSNAGRAMMAVRDHDLAAAALGVDP